MDRIRVSVACLIIVNIVKLTALTSVLHHSRLEAEAVPKTETQEIYTQVIDNKLKIHTTIYYLNTIFVFHIKWRKR